MPVGIIVDFDGATLDQADRIRAKPDSTSGGTRHGPLFHWSTQTDSGHKVVDVWDSRVDFESFAAEQIEPACREVGVPNLPTYTFHEVHMFFPE